MTSDKQHFIRLGSGEMFDRIALRYDLLNRLMSLGMDRHWRKKTVQALDLKPGQRVLDVATGTADLALAIANVVPQVKIEGVDPSENMLRIGHEKIHHAGYAGRIHLQRGTAEALPFADQSFDAVTIAFGIRNVIDREKALREMARVTKPGGRLAVLEVMQPQEGFLAPFAQLYVRYILPILGGTLSASREYQYLEQSMLAFPPAAQFIDQINNSRWKFVSLHSFAFGACQLFLAEAR